jgi:hypothetical protein
MLDVSIFAVYHLLNVLGTLWSLLLVPLRLIGLNVYKITHGPKIHLALKRLPKQGSIIKDEDDVRGWIWGLWYVGYVCDKEIYPEIWIVTTHNFYYELIHEVKRVRDDVVLRLHRRVGPHATPRLVSIDFNATRYIPKKNQEKPLRLIIDYYNQNRNAVVLVHGPPNSGKSTLAILLAKELRAGFCPIFDPTEPGSNIFNLHSNIGPDQNTPLIVVLEEFDIMIQKIHEGIPSHRDIEIFMKNKSSYNTAMDMINNGLYPNMIIIMTTNKCPEYFDSLDPSYIRDGRVGLRIKME